MKNNVEKNPYESLSPERIRSIREKLNLSQSEAGEIIGGGPRAFTKYESGTIKPAASIINLLRILEENPLALKLLGKKEVKLNEGGGRSPFEVTGKHIESLDQKQITTLVRRLLAAEAFSHSLPFYGIHVAEIITAPDGGEDARIEWKEGLEKTRYLKGRLNQFQAKSGKISNISAGKEVLDKKKNIKPMVKSVLERGGYYTILCGCNYAQKEIQKKEEVIRKTIRKTGLNIDDYQVAFFDAGMIAEWVNTHSSVAVWLLENTEFNAIGRFRSWSYWKSSPEHNIELVEDERIKKVREKLFPQLFAIDPDKVVNIAPISEPHSIRRIVGPAWVGKSRILLEALNNKDDLNSEIASITDLVLYFDNKGDLSNSVKIAVQSLADSATRAIVIVDQCSAQMHNELVNLVRRTESKLSLITLDDELAKESGEVIAIYPAVKEEGKVVIEGILKKLIPNLPSEDCRRLVKFSQGFSKIAVVLADAWMKGSGIVDTFEKFVKTIVVGQEQSNPDLILRGAQLLSIFGIVFDEELDFICELDGRITPEELRWVINELEKRGIIQRKGRAIMTQPRPISLCLAEGKWKEWGENKWDNIFIKSSDKINCEGLRERAAGQLALLNTPEDKGNEIGRYLLRYRGPLDSLEKISKPGFAKIFSSLSEIDAESSISLLERILKGFSTEDLRNISGDTRRNIIWALEKICFCPNTFERAAKILLDFAVAENESWGNNATGQFKSLFPSQLGNTAANGEMRLRFIKDSINEAADKNDYDRLILLIKALVAGSEMNHFSRSVGSETHGSRPSLESWQPKTWQEWFNYIESFCDHLIELAERKDDVGNLAKKELGYKFRSLATRGDLLKVAERAVEKVTAVYGNYWSEAYEGLGDVFEFDKDGLSEEAKQRIQKLIEDLKPKTLNDRVLILLTEMPWDYPCEQKMSFAEKGERQKKDVEDFAKELAKSSEDLKKVIQSICFYDLKDKKIRGHRNTALFATILTKQLKDPIQWFELIKDYVKGAELSKIDACFLAGFLLGLNDQYSSYVEEFKKEIAHNEYAPMLLTIGAYTGINEQDVLRVIDCVKCGLIKPQDLWQWSGGGVLNKGLTPEEINPLFDFLLSLDSEGEAVCICLDLMAMYSHGQYEILNNFLPQIKIIAEKYIAVGKTNRNGMDEYYFQEIIKYFLDQGKNNADAKEIAFILSQNIAKYADKIKGDLVNPIMPKLLSEFSEVSWQFIGKAIVSDKKTTWKFEGLLSDKYSFGEKQEPAILSLPEDVLFSWCHANQEIAPAFTAAVIPVLTSQNPQDKDIMLHPILLKLLNEFGHREDVLIAISCNVGTYGWSGSRTSYYKLYEEPFKSLENHPIKQVRFWAQKMIQDLGLQKDAAQEQDDEQDAHWLV